MAKILRSAINKAVHTTGYHITKLEKPLPAPAAPQKPKPPTAPKKPDPKDYSTMDNPQEVPCQKETYYFALNNYVGPNDKVLDVGSGLGYGMNILSIKAKEVWGIDVDKKAVSYSKNELLGHNPKAKDILYFDGYRTPFKNNQFDVVTCVDVLEHVKEYDKFVDELLRISRKAVIFATPNRRPEYTNPDGTPRNYWHLREWNHKELDDILSKHAKVDWFFIDGKFEGPFKINKQPSSRTLVLMPVLVKAKTTITKK